MMKLLSTLKGLLTVLAFLSLTPQSAQAQITVFEDQSISFGSFSFIDMGNVAEITIDTAGNISSFSNVAILSAPIHGEYTLSGGNVGAVYTLTVPASIQLTGAGPGDFTFDNIVVAPNTGSFDGFGGATFSLGGRLQSVGGGVQYGNGAYSGNLDITVAY